MRNTDEPVLVNWNPQALSGVEATGTGEQGREGKKGRGQKQPPAIIGSWRDAGLLRVEFSCDMFGPLTKAPMGNDLPKTPKASCWPTSLVSTLAEMQAGTCVRRPTTDAGLYEYQASPRRKQPFPLSFNLLWALPPKP